MTVNKSETNAKPRAAKVKPAKIEEKAVTPAAAEQVVEPVVPAEQSEEPKVQNGTQIRMKQLDPAMYVTVRNGFNGTLIYKSRKTGERFQWDEFGDEQDMELQELKNAKNSNKAFFENGWFLIDDPAVIAFLGLERCYQNTLSYTELDELFGLEANEVRARLARVPKGQRLSVAYRAHQLIAEGSIDSLSVIHALEDGLDMKLIEG